MVDVVEGVLGKLWISYHSVVREPWQADQTAWQEVLMSLNAVLYSGWKLYGCIHLILNFLN